MQAEIELGEWHVKSKVSQKNHASWSVLTASVQKRRWSLRGVFHVVTSTVSCVYKMMSTPTRSFNALTAGEPSDTTKDINKWVCIVFYNG